jgi:hypothetical protein
MPLSAPTNPDHAEQARGLSGSNIVFSSSLTVCRHKAHSVDSEPLRAFVQSDFNEVRYNVAPRTSQKPLD